MNCIKSNLRNLARYSERRIQEKFESILTDLEQEYPKKYNVEYFKNCINDHVFGYSNGITDFIEAIKKELK